MSNAFDDGYEISPIRDSGYGYDTPYRGETERHQPAAVSAATPTRVEESVIITLSPEAKVVLENIKHAEHSAETERAKRGAKEIAAITGVTEAEAVQVAQPLRSPPPAKGAALFQANLTAEKTNT